MNVDSWHLIYVQRTVIVEIALLDSPILESDLAKERGTKAVDDCALHLRLDGVGIDRDATIHRECDTLAGDLTDLGDFTFGHLLHEGPENGLYRDSATRPLR